MGAIVQNLTQTVSNLFGLIRGGGGIVKALGDPVEQIYSFPCVNSS